MHSHKNYSFPLIYLRDSVFLENAVGLTGAQLIKKFPDLCRTRLFITVFKSSRGWVLSWARWIEFTSLHFISLSPLILSRDLVTIDGVWIGNWICWTLTEGNYKTIVSTQIHTLCSLLQHVRSFLSLLCLHRLWLGNGFQRRGFPSFLVHVLTGRRLSHNSHLHYLPSQHHLQWRERERKRESGGGSERQSKSKSKSKLHCDWRSVNQ
jgi:hypothetical protein